MTVNKRKKNSRQRGSWTHGWGEKKKHRGAGSRGGRGMAGTGKRADAKKPSIWKEKYFGKFGFVSRKNKKIVGQNIEYLEKNLEKLIKNDMIKKEGDHYVVNSKKIGFNKLLGKGRATKKFKIDIDYASKKAIESVQKAGGTVNCRCKVEVKEKKEGV
jgi:large subunit ribosomal protein L15